MTTYKGTDYTKPDFKDIKLQYEWFEMQIYERFETTKSVSRWVCPYSLGIDFMSTFTPIEEMTWQALRSYGHAPFYPQYPVGRYFLDFGNPIVKVGIECDGKEFHKDKDRDTKRDMNLQELGWTIYRISGADCNRIVQLTEYDEYRDKNEFYQSKSEYYHTTIEGLIECLAVRYFNQRFYGDPHDSVNMMCRVLKDRVSVQTDDWDKELSDAVQDYYNKYYSKLNDAYELQ